MKHVAFTAPHALASKVGIELLQEGAHAVDAMIAAAAAISVCYPHMNSIGGDGFWLIHIPGQMPVAIDACGISGRASRIDQFIDKGLDRMPTRGPGACVTQAGTISGWQLARSLMEQRFKKNNLSLDNILSPARDLARNGIKVTKSLASASQKVHDEIEAFAGSHADNFAPYKEIFTVDGKPLTEGTWLKNPDLAGTLGQLIHSGLSDFYVGDLATHMASHLQSTGSVLSLADFEDYSAKEVEPLNLSLSLNNAKLYNLPPPTQGLASLLILAIYDKIYRPSLSSAERVHYLIEATKSAFKLRDAYACDPSRRKLPADLFAPERINLAAQAIDGRASAWPQPAKPGDTVWMGCTDKNGIMVSFIQSVYWEFGSAVVIPETGIVWNNRGSSFNLQAEHHNRLGPGLKPFHTLNPAFAHFDDGTRMVYGTMGGEGQPQTQAAIFTRAFYDNIPLVDAIAQGRWLLGRTWGEADASLKLEADLYREIGRDLEKMGHNIDVVAEKSEMMGHAGAVISAANGELSSACDPRSDGLAIVA